MGIYFFLNPTLSFTLLFWKKMKIIQNNIHSWLSGVSSIVYIDIMIPRKQYI